jgi:cytidylate kinase
MIITFDGPSVSGKSSLARALAVRLSYYYINSGMLFRGLSYCLLKRYHVLPERLQYDEEFLDCFKQITYCYDLLTGNVTIVLNSVDITHCLKTKEIDLASSLLGNDKAARVAITKYIRELAQKYKSITIDGRDCGSMTFPNADYKFYVTASLDVRAQRWQADQANLGARFSLEEAKDFLQTRDKNDSEREYSPLVVPKDAIILDTTHMTREETLAWVTQRIAQKKEEA